MASGLYHRRLVASSRENPPWQLMPLSLRYEFFYLLLVVLLRSQRVDIAVEVEKHGVFTDYL